MASYFHASPMVYTIIYVKHSLSINYRALDQYQENFTELQHKNNVIFLLKHLLYSHTATFTLLTVIFSLLSFKGNACF